MATTSQSHPQPRKVIIKPYPWNSAIAHTLVAALDKELDEIYPDFETLPHPNFPKSIDGNTKKPTNNPVPTLTATTPTTSPTSQPYTSNDTLTLEQISSLHFHIAFDITESRDPTSDTPGTPIGCMGVKLMPYFPHHQEQANTVAPPPSPSARPRYAEIKRAYVAPQYRGSMVLTAQSPEHPTRLAEALVRTVQNYAKDVLRADKLVLETGVRQRAAVKLYERLGWRRIEEYGH